MELRQRTLNETGKLVKNEETTTVFGGNDQLVQSVDRLIGRDRNYFKFNSQLSCGVAFNLMEVIVIRID